MNKPIAIDIKVGDNTISQGQSTIPTNFNTINIRVKTPVIPRPSIVFGSSIYYF